MSAATSPCAAAIGPLSVRLKATATRTSRSCSPTLRPCYRPIGAISISRSSCSSTRADSFALFKDALTTNPQLSVDVMREREYYAKQSQRMAKVLSFVAYFVGGIMAVGALFGALNTMYSAVSARSLRDCHAARHRLRRDCRRPVGAHRGAAARVPRRGNRRRPRLGVLQRQCREHARQQLHPGRVPSGGEPGTHRCSGIIWACVIGLVGGLFPAIRAARLPIATALARGLIATKAEGRLAAAFRLLALRIATW